jgi:RNA polymerase sigma-70 factor (ECF subfamily)
LSNQDRKSFVAAIAERHGGRLRRFLSQRLRNRADTPDLVQEVYLRLLRVERHEEIRSPEAYLITVASHLLREHSLRQNGAPATVDIDELVADLHTLPEDDPAMLADAQQRLKKIERVLEKMPPKAHAVLLMHRRDGFSLDEIAGRLGVSRSMVKKYLSRALSVCRQRFEQLNRE